MAEKDQNSDTDGEKKSSKMLIIVAAAVLLLGGGGAAYYFLFMGGETTEEGIVEPEAEVAKELHYFDLSKPFIVNYPKGSGARLLQVSASLMVEEEKTKEELKKHEPMIRNNILMLLSAQKPEELKTVKGKQQLRMKMLEDIGAVMEKMTNNNKVKELFFTSFVMQ